ncbi:MAG: pyridoxamine kinase, partial [Candidatus Ornithospirochaeta sp.]
MKKAVTIQDISCVGKCSLTVALPILSASRVETAVIPTALLSTHTGFSGFFFHDLTKDIAPISSHWKKEGFSFDAIYTGYLGSVEQVDIVSAFIDDFKSEDTMVVVDPAMADDGKMYSGFDLSFASHMARLCRKGDFILPNMTEASFLLGEDYVSPLTDRKEAESIIRRLSTLTGGSVVLKGIKINGCEDRIGSAYLEKGKEDPLWYFHSIVEESFCGTGDVYASAFTASLLSGKG